MSENTNDDDCIDCYINCCYMPKSIFSQFFNKYFLCCTPNKDEYVKLNRNVQKTSKNKCFFTLKSPYYEKRIGFGGMTIKKYNGESYSCCCFTRQNNKEEYRTTTGTFSNPIYTLNSIGFKQRIKNWWNNVNIECGCQCFWHSTSDIFILPIKLAILLVFGGIVLITLSMGVIIILSIELVCGECQNHQNWFKCADYKAATHINIITIGEKSFTPELVEFSEEKKNEMILRFDTLIKTEVAKFDMAAMQNQIMTDDFLTEDVPELPNYYKLYMKEVPILIKVIVVLYHKKYGKLPDLDDLSQIGGDNNLRDSHPLSEDQRTLLGFERAEPFSGLKGQSPSVFNLIF
mgnify:FL=1